MLVELIVVAAKTSIRYFVTGNAEAFDKCIINLLITLVICDNCDTVILH